MAWTSMHMAVGMACGGAAAGLACITLRRGYRWIPLAMTLGAVWAIVPDLPRVWREDFPSLPFAAVLGQKSLEASLHAWGDLFCFHGMLDAQPRELALPGLALILLQYNLALALLWWLGREHRDSAATRSRLAHAAHLPRRRAEHSDTTDDEPARSSHLSRPI